MRKFKNVAETAKKENHEFDAKHFASVAAVAPGGAARVSPLLTFPEDNTRMWCFVTKVDGDKVTATYQDEEVEFTKDNIFEVIHPITVPKGAMAGSFSYGPRTTNLLTDLLGLTVERCEELSDIMSALIVTESRETLELFYKSHKDPSIKREPINAAYIAAKTVEYCNTPAEAFFVTFVARNMVEDVSESLSPEGVIGSKSDSSNPVEALMELLMNR